MSELPKEEETLTPEQGKSDPPIKPKNSKSVAVYLVILFAAAFALLLIAFFQQQRSSDQLIGNLQNSVDQFQTVDELREENRKLQEQAEEHEALIEELLALGFVTRSEDGTLHPARELNLDELLANGINLVQGPCILPEE